MTFRAELIRKILIGQKTVTRRACSQNPRSPWSIDRCALTPGRDYAVQEGRAQPAIARIRIVSIDRQPLGILTRRGAHREGFDGIEAFEATWIAIHGSYHPGLLVWRIEFQLSEILRRRPL